MSDETFYPGRMEEGRRLIAIARIRLFVPGVIQPRLNGRLSRASHWTISEWTNRWHRNVRLCWLSDGRPTWQGPGRMIFTAHVTRKFDDDNLMASLKPIRDEAVRLIFDQELNSRARAKDDPSSGHEFTYLQDVRPHNRGVLVTVEKIHYAHPRPPSDSHGDMAVPGGGDTDR